MVPGAADSLEGALAAHQRGELEQAARVYRRLLAEDPMHADAMHLLGVMAIQQGNPSLGVELIGRAVAINPGVAAFHANLAEAHRVLGQLDRAADCCRAALRLQPGWSEAANTLGLILLAQGSPAEAAAQFETALRLRPDSALACNNLGEALRQQGAPAQAAAWFRRALQLDPALAEAHSNLGQLLLREQDPEAALFHSREAVRLRPGSAEALNNLGNALRARGRPVEARACYAEALRLRPDLALTYSNMGQALQQEGKPAEAVGWYEQALRLAPDVARPRFHLGTAFEETEDLVRAGEQYEAAVRLDPQDAEAHNALGWVRHDAGRTNEALHHYREALRLEPGLPAALCNLGLLRLEEGDFAAAEEAYRAALRQRPRHAGVYARLADMLGERLPAADEAAMRQLLADPQVGPAGRRHLHFGLAHVCDARRNYAEAAEHLRQANAFALAERRRRGRGYDPAAHAAFVAGLQAAFNPGFFERVRGLGLDSTRPVFVFGLPRSGTTLTEQILAAHPQAFGIGEQRFGPQDFGALAGPPATDADRFTALGGLDRTAVERIGRRHLDRLDGLNVTARRVVDKTTDNYLFLGLLAALFPRARFIHCRRDLRDVAVSCWMAGFRDLPWTNDLGHIATRFQEYHGLMGHWRRVLPVPLLEVDYEETVSDPEGVARRLVSFCGLDWDPACLAFHQNKRPVRSASFVQVRQPVYRHAVARWNNYQFALGELFARLPCPGGAPAPAAPDAV
jgi:tetratricopeptide (TPR) repeat protein